jgi:hypothetical protein
MSLRLGRCVTGLRVFHSATHPLLSSLSKLLLGVCAPLQSKTAAEGRRQNADHIPIVQRGVQAYQLPRVWSADQNEQVLQIQTRGEKVRPLFSFQSGQQRANGAAGRNSDRPLTEAAGLASKAEETQLWESGRCPRKLAPVDTLSCEIALCSSAWMSAAAHITIGPWKSSPAKENSTGY